MLLQAMADQFGVPVTDYADAAFKAPLSAEVQLRLRGVPRRRPRELPEGGLLARRSCSRASRMVLPKNVWQYVVQIPRMAAARHALRAAGRHAVQPRRASRRRSTTSRRACPDAEVYVHPHRGEAGAIGAALETLRVVQAARPLDLRRPRRRRSTSTYTTRNDETTRCHFCPNNCSRTFIDTRRPTAARAATSPGSAARRARSSRSRRCKRSTRSARSCMTQFPEPRRLRGASSPSGTSTRRSRCPRTATLIDDVEVKKTLLGAVKQDAGPPRRSSARPPRPRERRQQHPHRHPARAQHLLDRRRSGGPTSRRWASTDSNVVFSDYTSEEMWAEGGKYGSIDPCYPVQGRAGAHPQPAVQASTRRSKLDYIFFPCITHMPTFVVGTMDTTRRARSWRARRR